MHSAKEAEAGITNHRNGTSDKTVITPDGELELSIPRDRHGCFNPALIRKYCRRFPGFDDTIVALYARGMSTRDIQRHVREIYGIDIAPDSVSAVTDSASMKSPPSRIVRSVGLCDRILRCTAREDSR